MQCQDKKHGLSFVLRIYLLCLWLVGCSAENGTPVTPPTEMKVSPSATASSTTTPLPTSTSTSSTVPIALPAVTMSPQEAEDALQELLKTNGNCTGKCLAGVRPDEMSVQEAVDQMARWGMLTISKGSDETTFIHTLPLAPQEKQVRVNLVVALRKETINAVHFHIPRREDNEFFDADVWLAHRESWRAFQFDNLLNAYGTPSFVGLRFATRDLEGNSIVYTIDIHYEQMNLEIGIGGLAHRNGQDFFICPSTDTHSLGIDINPEPPLKEREQASPITWQALTGSDLQTFHQTFTDATKSDGCVATTLEKIRELDPYFH